MQGRYPTDAARIRDLVEENAFMADDERQCSEEEKPYIELARRIARIAGDRRLTRREAAILCAALDHVADCNRRQLVMDERDCQLGPQLVTGFGALIRARATKRERAAG